MTSPTYRVRRYYRKDDRPKKYQCTYEIIDDSTEQVVAFCDLIGKAAFTELEIFDHRQQLWRMKPNRKIMPSGWVVTEPGEKIAVQFDQKILGKMINPLYKTVLVLQDREGKEVYRLVDPRSSIPDRLLGLGPDEWALMSGDRLSAKLVRLPGKTEPPKGIFGKLKSMLMTSDPGIVSHGSRHVLPAPVALGMYILFRELTDSSGG